MKGREKRKTRNVNIKNKKGEGIINKRIYKERDKK